MIVYIVQKLDWKWNDDWYLLSSDEPVIAYEDRSRAEEFAATLEAQERAQLRGMNLAERFGGAWLCLAGEEALQKRLHEAGAPTTSDILSESGWEAIWAAVPEEKIWEICDAIRFTDVVAVELAP